MKVKTPILL